MYADLCKLLSEKATEWFAKYLRVERLEEGPAGAGFYFDVSGKTPPDAATREKQKGLGAPQGPFESKDAALTEGKRITSFKRLLLNRCQQEFMREDAYKELDLQDQVDSQTRRTWAEANHTPSKEEDLCVEAAWGVGGREEEEEEGGGVDEHLPVRRLWFTPPPPAHTHTHTHTHLHPPTLQ
jgi:hypothetical protein